MRSLDTATCSPLVTSGSVVTPPLVTERGLCGPFSSSDSTGEIRFGVSNGSVDASESGGDGASWTISLRGLFCILSRLVKND